MASGIDRRRVLAVLAAVSVPWPVAMAGNGVTRWRGVALGARASLTIAAPAAQGLVQASLAEVKRLEGIFSLYDANSELSRLNREGRLSHPSPDLLRVLSLVSSVHQATQGAFDPTVQPLWDLYARWHVERGVAPPQRSVERTLALVGWHQVQYSSREVRFVRQGMAMTLNGVAQGYIADRVADLLRSEGLEHVLVETGEAIAVGHHPEGRPWKAALRGTAETVGLDDGALAVSEPLATHFDAAGQVGHILDPSSGVPGGCWSRVAVQAPSAALADALSTSACLLDETRINALRETYPDVRVAAFGDGTDVMEKPDASG